LEITLDELDAARDWMLLLGRKTARERLASFFELLALRAQPALDVGVNRQIELPLSREETANYLGLTLETVSRQLSQLNAACSFGPKSGPKRSAKVANNALFTKA